MLEIKNLCVSVDETPLLKGLDLLIRKGEVHAIMGPNGAGKSTLAKVIAGHPAYEVLEGEILFEGEDILEMEPEERAQAGLFMGFQYPVEIPGVSNREFLRAALNARRQAMGQEALGEEAFDRLMAEEMERMGIKAELKMRNVNEGFSGGEKKRNEILQMAILNPRFAVLDETDSGLDIDALKLVAKSIRQVMHGGMGLLLITHYQRLLDYLRPDFVHVMVEGRIAQSGGAELAEELEKRGYQTHV